MLKKGQQLKDDHHVLRYVPKKHQRTDGDGNILGILYAAFELRSTEESLSVNWVEYYEGDPQQQTTRCIQEFRCGYDVKKSSAFGIAKVANIRKLSESAGKSIRVIFSPTENLPSHTSIQKIPRDDIAFLELMATEAFDSLVMNSDIPDLDVSSAGSVIHGAADGPI